jgi:hypothetical protein
MPRLVQKNDGLYIVRHFYQQNATWQIDADGVLFLKGRGVRAGELFETDLFMEMWMRGMVYTGTRRRTPAGEPRHGPPSPDDVALRERAATLYRALYHRNLEEAYAFLLPRIRVSKTLDQFKTAFMGPRPSGLTSWKIQSLCSVPMQNDAMPEATRLGWVIVDLEMQDDSGARDNLYAREESWFQIQGVWYWVWRGWQRQNAPDKAG